MIDSIPSPTRDSPRSDMPGEELRGLREAIRPTDDGRERLRKGAANVDPFDITDIMAKYAPTRGDPKMANINNETDFNWKRYEVYGKQDFAEMRMYHDQGWRPVPHSMFPGRFAPEGTAGPVIVKDMILMERPMRLTFEARQEELREANRAMQVHRQKMAEAPEGQAPRMAPQLRETREAIQIPE